MLAPPGRLRSPQRLRIVAALTLAVALIAACGEDEPLGPRVSLERGEPVRIGVAVPQTGPRAGLGEPIVRAVQLALEGITVGGRNVALVVVDTACTREGGLEAARSLIERRVVAVVGPACSSAVAAAQPVFEAAGVPHISPSATAIALTRPPGREPYATFSRVTYSDAAEGGALAQLARERFGATNAYVVAVEGAYGEVLRDEFVGGFGSELIATASFATGTTDFTSTVRRIVESAPDVVLFAGLFEEAAAFVEALRAAGVTAPVLAPDGVRTTRFVDLAGTAAEGTIVAVPAPRREGEALEVFTAGMDERFGEGAAEAAFAVEAYDAARVLIEALRSTATPLDGDLVIDLEALAVAVRAVVIEGAGGRVAFDGRGENIGEGTPVTFQIVEGGLFMPLSAEPGSIAPPPPPPAVPQSQGGGGFVTARTSQIGYASRVARTVHEGEE